MVDPIAQASVHVQASSKAAHNHWALFLPLPPRPWLVHTVNSPCCVRLNSTEALTSCPPPGGELPLSNLSASETSMAESANARAAKARRRAVSDIREILKKKKRRN